MPCLYSANFPIKRILELYDNGQFEHLRKYLFQLKDYLLRDELTIDLEHQLLYINILEAKAFYCMGKFDSVAMKIDDIEANTRRNVKRGGGKYQYLLYHDLHLNNINDCEHGQKCICNKYNFSGYESLDAWYEIDKYFANIWVVVKKKKDLEDKDYYRIPEPTVVKYNGERDVMYLLRGPNQSKNSIPLAPVDDQEGIHEYDIKMAQYNRIQLINDSTLMINYPIKSVKYLLKKAY